MCNRWDQEVRETRHKIMAAARYLIKRSFWHFACHLNSWYSVLIYFFGRFLIKNDIMFVAERDVETHIWKTVYYQVKDSKLKCYLPHYNLSARLLKC